MTTILENGGALDSAQIQTSLSSDICQNWRYHGVVSSLKFMDFLSRDQRNIDITAVCPRHSAT